MASQQRLSLPCLPECISEQTKKDKLFNDLISLLKSMGKKWQSGEVKSRRSFLVTLANVLWYIDGHQESLQTRGCHVPELFKPFTGYNKSECSKHRKRSQSNLVMIPLPSMFLHSTMSSYCRG